MHICVYVTIKKKEEIMNLKGNEGYERERGGNDRNHA